jgi:N-terminal domain of reverse transcriptase
MDNETPHGVSDEWRTIPWRKLERYLFRLQKRIYKAKQCGDTRAVRGLKRVLKRSKAAQTLAVRQVTQDNRGKRTAGIDGVKNLNLAVRLEMAATLSLAGKASPVRRVWIPKPGKDEKRPLGMPIWYSYCTFIQRSLGWLSQAGYADMRSHRPHTRHANTLQASCRRMPATMASTGRPPQGGDDLRCQRDPARPPGRRPQASQAPLLAPLAKRGNMHVEQLGRLLHRVSSVAPLATWALLWPFWTPRRYAIGPAYPANLARRARSTEARMPPFGIEARGNLLVSMRGRQRAPARHAHPSGALPTSDAGEGYRTSSALPSASGARW